MSLPENKISDSSGSGDMFLAAESPLLSFESSLAEQGIFFAAGIDEAGRGCCAGPVVAAAVLFTKKDCIPAGIFDSKQLSEKKRMELRRKIMETPGVYYSVAEISAEEIDASDILRATWKAMANALSGIIPPAEFALVDGNPVKGGIWRGGRAWIQCTVEAFKYAKRDIPKVAKMLGMSQTGYSKYETGENDIPTVVLIKLANFYGTSIDYLLGQTNSPKRYE